MRKQAHYQPTPRHRRSLRTAVFAPLALCAVSAWAQNVTLNLEGVSINEATRAIAAMTGRNIVVDPRVKGTVTIVSEQPVSTSDAYDQFLSAIRLQGYTVVESSGVYRLMPEADARRASTTLLPTGKSAEGLRSNQIATQIFRLDYQPAATMIGVLRPMLGPRSSISVNNGTNSIIVTDYADNLRRVASVIATQDMPPGTDVEIIPLQHALASDLVPLLQNLMGASGNRNTPNKPLITGDVRSNSIILRTSSPASMKLAQKLITQLDVKPAESPDAVSGNIYVVHLKNASAVKIAETLRAAISGKAQAAPAAGTQAKGATVGKSTGGQIQADVATNSLIITAPAPQYRQIRAVIDRLDTRRAQVFVECLVAEVSSDRAAELGIQWQTALGKKGDSSIGVIGTNYKGKDNIIGLAATDVSKLAGATPPAGINLGVFKKTAGVYVLGFLARFLEESGEGNVLSTPNILTLDNEEAKITVGSNVPFVTGRYTNSGQNSTNPFQTIERKDVGLTLKVKPQISESGTIKMDIFQEISSVGLPSADGLTTNKRTIETKVIVDDGAVVVLGGLLTDEYTNNEQKIPFLGDIPVMGDLFKSRQPKRKKRNLMVFLRPVVLRDQQSTNDFSASRYELLRSEEQQLKPSASIFNPVKETPRLPPLTKTEDGNSFRLSYDLPLTSVRSDRATPTPAPTPAPAPAPQPAKPARTDLPRVEVDASPAWDPFSMDDLGGRR